MQRNIFACGPCAEQVKAVGEMFKHWNGIINVTDLSGSSLTDNQVKTRVRKRE
jgi:hypothetical protein